jgi:sugar/nucleoside kinase (ribokinase family)
MPLSLGFCPVICALGDLLLDVVVRLDAPIAADTDTYGRTRVAPGGQAANVTAWAAALGGSARFVGKHARDAAGRILTGELRRLGVEVVGPEVDAGTGTVVSLADPEGRRSMLTDRGVAPEFRADEVEPAWFDGVQTLHLAGYSLVRAPIREAALRAATLARERGARVSLDLSATSAIEELGVERFREIAAELRPDVVFGNADEVRLVGTLEAKVIVEKLGARGCVVRRGRDERAYDAEPTELVDTTGAGDALAAGFLVDGPELGLRAAARCVATMGAFPP